MSRRNDGRHASARPVAARPVAARRVAARQVAARQVAEHRGKSAELLCLWHLRLKGYRILARRYKTPVGEVDLIARRGAVLAAIEVKARADFASAGEAITPRQRQRISRALAHFLGRRPDLAALAARFDVMLVAPRRWPHHLVDAWREE